MLNHLNETYAVILKYHIITKLLSGYVAIYFSHKNASPEIFPILRDIIGKLAMSKKVRSYVCKIYRLPV
jgi:hypothetical protein